jgi:hypothetical protein
VRNVLFTKERNSSTQEATIEHSNIQMLRARRYRSLTNIQNRYVADAGVLLKGKKPFESHPN